MRLIDKANITGAPSFHRPFGESVGKHGPGPAVISKTAFLSLSILLAACSHKTNPPQTQTIAPPVSTSPKPNPEPVVLSSAANAIPAPPLPELKPAAHSHKPARQTKPAAVNTQQASSGSGGVSAIGQLSSGEPYDQRSRTSDAIIAIERGLNGLHRKLSNQDQKTAAQIREFLKQARTALASGDVDGAETLAAKAKVLLAELIH